MGRVYREDHGGEPIKTWQAIAVMVVFLIILLVLTSCGTRGQESVRLPEAPAVESLDMEVCN